MTGTRASRLTGRVRPRPGVAADRAAGTAAVAIACLANVVVLADATIVNVALPSIQDDLSISAAGLPWVVNSYTMVFGCLLLMGGHAADRLGPKWPFVAGMLLFSAGSFGCACAGAGAALFVGRAVQGLGGALFSPAALAVATGTGTVAGRARAMALWSGAGASAVALGPVLGGLLTAAWGWASIFWLPAAVCLGVAIVGLHLLPPGEVLPSVPDPRPLRRARHLPRPRRAPAFPTRRVAAACVVVALGCAAMVGAGYACTLWLQAVLRFDPAVTGVLLLPLSLGIVAGAWVAPALLRRAPVRTVATAGLATAAAGAALILPAPVDVPLLWLLPALAVLAVGFGIQSVPVTLAATTVPRRVGRASAVYQTAGQLGGGSGLAILTALAGAPGRAGGDAALVAGYRVILAGAAAALVVAALAAWLLLVDAPRSRPPATLDEGDPVQRHLGRRVRHLRGEPDLHLAGQLVTRRQADRRSGGALDPGGD